MVVMVGVAAVDAYEDEVLPEVEERHGGVCYGCDGSGGESGGLVVICESDFQCGDVYNKSGRALTPRYLTSQGYHNPLLVAGSDHATISVSAPATLGRPTVARFMHGCCTEATSADC